MKLNTHDINILSTHTSVSGNFLGCASCLVFIDNPVKRALAEAGLLTLSWYKTKEENKMLIALASKGISNVTQLLERL